MIELLAALTFLRPGWLLAFPVLALLLLWLQRRSNQSGWGQLIDPAIIQRLSVSQTTAPTSATSRIHRLLSQRWLLLLPLAIICLALAGPSWQQLPGTAAANRQAMVIALDLSPSMLATDVKPNRLALAQVKLLELLRQRRGAPCRRKPAARFHHRVAGVAAQAV